MRVLVLTERYPPHYTGGYEIACQAVAEGLRARGHAVAVLTSDYTTPNRSPDEGHVSRRLHRPQASASLFEQALWERRDNATLARALAAHRPDVVYAWSLLQLFPSLHRTLRGVPVVYNVQDTWFTRQLAAADERRAAWRQASPGVGRGLLKATLRAALDAMAPAWWRRVDVAELPLGHLVFCSEFQRRLHLEAGLPAGDSRILYNGVDLERFAPVQRPDAAPFKVLFVGRLVAEKGAHVALEAVTALRERGVDATLTVAGVPAYPLDYFEALRKRAGEGALAGSVRLLTNVPNAELPALYAAHDALAFPSRHREGLPMTLLEAMATGLPVVSTTVGGSAEILASGETGLVVEPEDVAGLAAALERLQRDAPLRASLGRAGRAWTEAHVSLDAIVDATLVYLQYVAARRGAA